MPAGNWKLLPRASLPSTPFKKATLKNAPGHGKKIVSAKVRGRDAAGDTAGFQFAPPPVGPAGPDHYYELVPLTWPLPDDGSSREWTSVPQTPPDVVRNVEMEIVIEVIPGDPAGNRTYFLDITAPEPCTEPTSGFLNKLQLVTVTLTGVGEAPYNAHFDVYRYYYNTDNQNGCGSGGQCTPVTTPCSVPANP